MTVRAQYLPGSSVVLATEQDVDDLVDAVLSQDFEHSVIHVYAEGHLNAAGFVDHQLSVGILNEGDDEVGSMRYYGPKYEGMYYGAGQVSKRPQGVFYCYQGHGEAWPDDSELTIDQIRKALKEFITIDRDRPSSIEWRAWPEGQEVGL